MTLTPKRGYRGRLDELSGGAEGKAHASAHENHQQSCQRHENMRHWSLGKGNQEWLTTTHQPSISNSIDSIGW